MPKQINWSEMADMLFYKSEFDMWFDLYITKKHSLHRLAEKFGYNHITIKSRLEYYAIPLRSRGGANNTAKYQQKLHFMDQRLVHRLDNKVLASKLKVNYSTVWKYKKGKSLCKRA